MANILRTFIVEDSRVIRENLVATLEEFLPIKVVGSAEDEAAAVSWLGDRGNDCDLAIIDIFLKRGTGIGVLKALAGRGPKLRRVVFSNFATAEVRRMCTELGAERVFDKSHDIDGLLDYCRQLADGKLGQATESARS